MSPKPAGTVQDYIADLDHPLKDTVVSLRKLLLGADPSISEEVKWNSPSFRTTDHFATMHLRAKDAVQLILHFGAKSKKTVAADAIPDPAGLLKWLGPDRASVSFSGSQDLKARGDALVAIVRQWIRYT